MSHRKIRALQFCVCFFVFFCNAACAASEGLTCSLKKNHKLDGVVISEQGIVSANQSVVIGLGGFLDWTKITELYPFSNQIASL